MYKIYLSIGYCILSIGLCLAQETQTISETPSVASITETLAASIETPSAQVIAESTTVKETVAEIVPAETQTIAETKPVPSQVSPQISLVKPGLSLMPTAYVRVSPKHPGETGLNADFLFNFYIGEIYEYINKKHIFFVPYRIFMFGADAKASFTIGQLLKGIGMTYGEEYATGRITSLLDYFDPGFYKQEQKYLPTVAVGMRGWLFTSMGTSFDFVEAFEGAQWILDYYVAISKKIGDYGFHFGYVYGNFIPSFLKEIQKANKNNSGGMWKWNINEDSHTFFVGFDMNVPWGTKKFTVESIFSSFDTFLINTSTGIYGFELAFLKIPDGFSIIGYWGFRTNLFTF